MTQFDFWSLFPDIAALVNQGISTSAGFTALWVLLTFSSFIIFSGYALAKYFHSKNRCYFYFDTLLGKVDKKTVHTERRTLRNTAREKEQQSKWPELWVEFDETLVEVDGQLQNTSDASVLFNSSTLADGLAGNRFLATGSGIITGFGVLGTFIGLQLGLGGLVFDSGTDTLIKGIQQLVGGAATAFVTSVWGVSLSLIYNILEKRLEREAQNRITALQVKIDTLFPCFSPATTLRDLKNDGYESRIALQGLAERIGNSMQEAVNTMSSSIQQGLEDSLRNVLAPAIDKLVTTSQDLQSRQAQGSEEALKSLIEAFLEKVSHEGDRHTSALNEASSSVGIALQDMTSKMTEFLQNLERQQAGLKDDQDKRSALLERNFETATTVLQDTIKNIEESFAHHNAATGSLIKQGEALGGSVQQQAQAMDVISQKMTDVTQGLERASGHLQATSETLRSSSGELGTAVGDASKRIQQSSMIVDKLVAENHRVEENVNRVMGLLDNIRHGIEASTTQLNQAAGTASDGYKAVSESYQQLQEQLKEHVEQLEEQVTKLLQNYAAMVGSQTAERMDAWNQHTTSYTETMTNAVESIAQAVDEIENKIRNR